MKMSVQSCSGNHLFSLFKKNVQVSFLLSIFCTLQISKLTMNKKTCCIATIVICKLALILYAYKAHKTDILQGEKNKHCATKLHNLNNIQALTIWPFKCDQHNTARSS